MAQEWLELNQRMRADKQREEELREALLSESGHQNTVGGGLQIAKIVRAGAVDYQAIPELQGVDLNQYRKAPVEFWRVTRA